MRFSRLIAVTLLVCICVAVPESRPTAPAVTGIRASQRDGQTFIVWRDAAAGVQGSKYRYDLYRSTSGPIIELSRAVLVEEGIYNNSAQLIGPKPYTQATRQNPDLRMSKIEDGGTPLPMWSGVAVHTNLATESAFYSVITRDLTGEELPSALSAGNSLMAPISESPGKIQPILQAPSDDASRHPGCCSISGTHNLPLWLRLHGSGGRAADSGDLQAFWGDSTMGHQDGIQSVFAVYEDHTGNAFATGGVRKLVLAPQDAVWSIDGNSASETFWYGYKDIPVSAVDKKPHIYPFTKAKLSFIVPWVIQRYGADPNRIYGISDSMGGYGQMQWSLRQSGLCAAIFMRVPILGPWQRIPSLIDVTAKGVPQTIPTTTETLPDDKTLYNEDTNVRAWIAQDCARNLPYLSWSSGRRDASLAEHRMWSYAVEMAKALKSCHYGFSFIWNNGVHDSLTSALENTLLEEYQNSFAKNVSYPAFTDFSLDSNYGNGNPNEGDPSGCVNCGWQWKVSSDTATSWSASFTNRQVMRQASTDVTPRNTQHFKPAPGTAVDWSTSNGQQGKVVVDSHGLVTVSGVQLSVQATILTINLP